METTVTKIDELGIVRITTVFDPVTPNPEIIDYTIEQIEHSIATINTQISDLNTSTLNKIAELNAEKQKFEEYKAVLIAE